jgi:hypothetical protein
LFFSLELFLQTMNRTINSRTCVVTNPVPNKASGRLYSTIVPKSSLTLLRIFCL